MTACSLFAPLQDEAQASLERLAAALRNVPTPATQAWHIDVSALPESGSPQELLRQVREWAAGSQRCLYVFRPAVPLVDVQAVEQRYTEAVRSKQAQRAYARWNHCNAACWYVGSSQSVAKRLAEHLGYGAKGTYALQLQHWARPLGIQLEFVCAQYAPQTDYAVVQALEDALWTQQQPMFGRQGRR